MNSYDTFDYMKNIDTRKFNPKCHVHQVNLDV
jgi:hypothetical protein